MGIVEELDRIGCKVEEAQPHEFYIFYCLIIPRYEGFFVLSFKSSNAFDFLLR
jgi:hypothetical protein